MSELKKVLGRIRALPKNLRAPLFRPVDKILPKETLQIRLFKVSDGAPDSGLYDDGKNIISTLRK